MKTRLGALSIAQTESRSIKLKKLNPEPSVLMKMSLGAQNMDTGPDGIGIAKNESDCAKHEYWTRCP
jgi:hypothetical protein